MLKSCPFCGFSKHEINIGNLYITNQPEGRYGIFIYIRCKCNTLMFEPWPSDCDNITDEKTRLIERWNNRDGEKK